MKIMNKEKIDPNKYCNRCRFLNVTEEEQNKIKLNDNQLTKHHCILFNRVLFHREYHPNIPRIEECYRLSNTNFEFKMFDNENIYGIILSKKAEKILKDIAKYQKSTYTEVVEKLILAEGRLIDHYLKDENDDKAYEYVYKLFIKYYYLTEKYDRKIASQERYDAKGFIVLNNKEMILSSKFATKLYRKLYKEYTEKFSNILAFSKANAIFEEAKRDVIYMTVKKISEEYQRLYGKDDN